MGRPAKPIFDVLSSYQWKCYPDMVPVRFVKRLLRQTARKASQIGFAFGEKSVKPWDSYRVTQTGDDSGMSEAVNNILTGPKKPKKKRKTDE